MSLLSHRNLPIVTAALALVSTAAAQHPDFQGTWNSATATPLERPAQLKDKPFFTPQEAAEWEHRALNRREDPKPDAAAAKNFASYNALFYETGTKVLKSLRTSIIIDPSDGKIPALTPAAAAAKAIRMESLRHPQTSTDLGLQDQCIVFPTAAAPMVPYIYNSNYELIQTDSEIMLNTEMIHDTRIIRMDGRPHISPAVRQWLGDSIGHWDGSTLVVDTTNFGDGNGFFGDAGGMYGSDRNLHVIEHFTLLDPNTMQYRFEVDDPTAFSQPWKGELTWSRSTERMYEYACHEGNYALTDLLNGARSQ